MIGIASFASAKAAHADYSMNTASNDCQTVSIGNYTTGEGIQDPCWTETTTNASVGDVLNVAIYYHNAGDATAPDVSFQLSDPTSQTISGNSGTVNFTAKVLVNGTVVSGGIVSANITGGPATLTFGHVANYTQGSGTNQTISNGSDIFTSSGLSIGDVAPGWNTQGVIKVSFNVVGSNSCTNCNNNGQAPTVVTYAPANLNSSYGSVTLEGNFTSYSSSNTTTWFQYRENGGAWIQTPSINEYLSNGNMSAPLSNLAQGNYDYEAVAQNSYGTNYGNDVSFTIGNNVTTCQAGYYLSGSTCLPIVTTTCQSGYYLSGSTCLPIVNTSCSYGYSWNGYSCQQTIQTCQSGYVWTGSSCVYQNQNITTTQLPSITTLGTIGVTSTSAAVDGYFNNNGCTVSTYFDYGTTQSFGSQTGQINQSAVSGSMAQSLSGLSPNTTYYYRAVGQNCAGTNYGTTNSFTTSGNTYNGGTTHTVVYDTNIGGGNAFLQLTIDNNETTVTGDTSTPYDITWKNISGSTLKDIVLEVNFPSQMTITNPGLGSVEPKKSSVIYHIDSLDPNETGQMTIIGTINSGMKQGDPVVAQAVAAFQNPKGDATENAIAYDADTFNVPGSIAGASLFGLGFLPNSLGGWLIIIFIILIIIIVAHYYFVGRHKQVTVVHTQAPIAPVPPAPAAPAPEAMVPDYTVYRPNPKQ